MTKAIIGEISSYSDSELKSLEKAIARELDKRAHAQKRAVVEAELEKILKKQGLSLGDVFPELADKPKKTVDKKTVSPIKYQHPENQKLNWTGKGPKPKWIRDWLAGGGSEEALVVNEA